MARDIVHEEEYKIAQSCVDWLIIDIEDRIGLGNEWEQIDPEVQREIAEEWARLIAAKFYKANKEAPVV